MALFSFPSQVNERAARLVAGVVATLAITALALGAWWMVPLLALGFLLRLGWGPKVSPLGRLASTLAPKLWRTVAVSGAPKRFAQGIGAAVTVSASLLFWRGWPTAGWALVGMIALFASLEAGLSFCLGCWLYGHLQRLGVFPPDVCVDCARRLSPEAGR